MATYTIKNITTTAATLDEARRLAAAAYLRHIAGIDAPEPTEQEIDALLSEVIAREIAEQVAEQAVIDFRNLPNWASWTGQEAAEALRAGILAGMTKTEARTAIDAQLPPTLTAAEFRAAVIQVLKTLSDAVIDGRDLGHQNEARAIMYLRDVAIR